MRTLALLTIVSVALVGCSKPDEATTSTTPSTTTAASSTAPAPANPGAAPASPEGNLGGTATKPGQAGPP